MRRALLIAMAIALIGGCAAPAAQPSPPVMPIAAPTGVSPGPTNRLAITRTVLPAEPSGFWSPVAVSDGWAVLYLTPQVANPKEREATTARLGVLDLGSQALRPLLTLRPGMQLASPSLFGSDLAWVETSATDLAGHGWRLHRTNIATARDEIVATDPGLSIKTQLLASHAPLANLSAGGLLYTVLVPGTNGPDWELRRRLESETVVDRIENAAQRRVAALAGDVSGATWVVATRLGASLNEEYELRERSWRESALTIRRLDGRTYGAQLRTTRIYLATDHGLVVTARAALDTLQAVGPGRTLDSFIVLSELALALDSTSRELSVIDLATGAAQTVDNRVTAGPFASEGTAAWYRVTDPSKPGELVLAHPSR